MYVCRVLFGGNRVFVSALLCLFSLFYFTKLTTMSSASRINVQSRGWSCEWLGQALKCHELKVAVKLPSLVRKEHTFFRLVSYCCVLCSDVNRSVGCGSALCRLVLLVALDGFVYLGRLGTLRRGITFILQYLHTFSICLFFKSRICSAVASIDSRSRGNKEFDLVM